MANGHSHNMPESANEKPELITNPKERNQPQVKTTGRAIDRRKDSPATKQQATR